MAICNCSLLIYFTERLLISFCQQLIAIDPGSQKVIGESNVFRSEWAPRFPPTVVFPFHQANVKATDAKTPIHLQWQSGELKPRIVVELSQDPTLSKRLFEKTVTGSEGLITPALAPGVYFWRLSAYYADSKQPFMGRINSFTLTKEEAKPVEEKPLPLRPPSPTPPLAIQWTVPDDSLRQMYIEKPTLDLSWASNRPEDIASYRIILKNESNPTDSPVQIESQTPTTKAKLNRAGRYMASIEAIGKDGKVLGKSDPKSFESTILPLLKSPHWEGGNSEFIAALDGQAQLGWSRVDGAKEYIFILMKDGKEIQKRKLTSTSHSLKELLPGDYTARLVSVDQYGRSSMDPTTKKIVVPDKSGLKAPSLKKIKVN